VVLVVPVGGIPQLVREPDVAPDLLQVTLVELLVLTRHPLLDLVLTPDHARLDQVELHSDLQRGAGESGCLCDEIAPNSNSCQLSR
jgi:hypothetical protein